MYNIYIIYNICNNYTIEIKIFTHLCGDRIKRIFSTSNFCTVADGLEYSAHATIIKLSVIVALIVPICRCRGVRRTRGMSILIRVRSVLMTTGMTRAVFAALKMIELSPTKLRPRPVAVT